MNVKLARKKFAYFVCIILLFSGDDLTLQAQDTLSKPGKYYTCPLIIGLQFQNLALPFHDLTSNFTHPGIGIGTEIHLNKKKNLFQQVQSACFLNREAGKGFFICSQAVYRPVIYKSVYAEIKAGMGWQRIYHPAQAYELKNGEWTAVTAGKSQLMIPFGMSIGYSCKKYDLSPFISYQVIPSLYYNKTIPLNFYSLFQLGTSMRIPKIKK